MYFTKSRHKFKRRNWIIMVMMTCGENEENAENKCDDYHGDELGLEYEVDEEVEFAEIQLDIKKMKKIVV